MTGARWICTTEASPWTEKVMLEARAVTAGDIEAIKASGSYMEVDRNTRYQAMDAHPWGGCFAEKGWYAMRYLTDEQKKDVLKKLFGPGDDSLNFTAGRTPMGASDFGLTMYTYDPAGSGGAGAVEPDYSNYELNGFTIDQDKKYLIPYIKAAMELVPDMPIFSSPWTPPAWLKNNGKLNGSDKTDNSIKDTPECFAAYARYFVKYLEAYAAEGIDIHAVTTQNEPTMDTPYPSCLWSGSQLNIFLRDYLCDAIDKYNADNGKNVEVWLGTFTDSNQDMVWPTFNDSVTSKRVGAYCFQWWGAPLAAKVHALNKDVKLVQSESKCGDGDFSWSYAEEQFDCFKEFLDAGVSQYFIWNMILEGKGENNAEPANKRWPQNAPIKVDGTTVRYCPSYYQVKHFSSNICSGARRVKVTGSGLGEGSVNGHVKDVRAIGFRNTDGEIVLNVKNSTDGEKKYTVIVNDRAFDVLLPSHSINTFKLDGVYENAPDTAEAIKQL